MRDIDLIIALVDSAVPSVRCEQLKVTHPADDNGLWFFRIPPSLREVQAESSTGMCPFIVETSRNAHVAHCTTREETAWKIVELLTAP